MTPEEGAKLPSGTRYSGKWPTHRSAARRHFADEFKAGAVRLVLDEGRSVGVTARDLDLTETGHFLAHSGCLPTPPHIPLYYLVALPATASLKALVRLAHQRWANEQKYQ